MKHLNLLLGILVFSNMACDRNRTNTVSESLVAYPIKPLYGSSVVRPFSSLSRQDTFRVVVNGESLLTGEAYMQIVSYSGKIVYSTTFPVRALLNHHQQINPKRDEKEVKKQIDEFFAPKHFIQEDSGVISYSYLSQQDSLTRIAYSPDLRKVVELDKFTN